MQEYRENNKIVIFTKQKKLTGVNYVLLWLAKNKKFKVVCKKDSEVKRYCNENYINYIEYNLIALLKEIRSSHKIITARTAETIEALILTIVTGNHKKVVKLKLRNDKTHTELIKSMVREVKVGWVDDSLFIEKIPTKVNYNITMISRLKPGKRILKTVLSILETGLKVNFKIRGDGELNEALKIIGKSNIVFINRKLDLKEYKDLIDESLVIVYPSHGSDITCRTVLEGMARGSIIINFEPLARSYVIDGKTGFNLSPDRRDTPLKITSILLNRKVLRKISLNSLKGAKKYLASSIPLPFL
ncbi:MAG: hypothetical protein ACPLSJ_01015 [Thermosulfidibacteraceae bacterium]|jgi:glycosyltransferase involved in cell wall biosynthesis